MYQHQTIEYDNILPAKIELNERTVNRCRGEPHWHEEMQLINPCEVHSLKKGSAKFISVYGTDRSIEDDVTAVKHYIEENYRQKIMSTDLEKLLHFKPSYVMMQFKKQTGMTIMGYAIRVRTKRALDDYLDHDIPIGEAAKKNGFCHYNHFTKACHKYYGASPTEIKKRNRGKQVSLPLDIPA